MAYLVWPIVIVLGLVVAVVALVLSIVAKVSANSKTPKPATYGKPFLTDLLGIFELSQDSTDLAGTILFKGGTYSSPSTFDMILTFSKPFPSTPRAATFNVAGESVSSSNIIEGKAGLMQPTVLELHGRVVGTFSAGQQYAYYTVVQ